MTRRRWWLVGGLAALVVAAAGGVLIGQSLARPGTPQEAASAYVRALESGDPAAVAATGADVSATALGAFAGASALIDDAEVTGVEQNGEAAATADIFFRLGEEKRTARLDITRVDGRWTVGASALGTATVTADLGSSVRLGDETVSVGEALLLLPAEYAVSAAPSSLLDGSANLLVLPGEDVEVTVEVTPLPAAVDAAQEQLDEHLAECTASDDSTQAPTTPVGCGIRIPWGTEFRDVTDIRYRIETSPEIALDATGFLADGGVLIATVTGTGQDGTERTTTYRTDSWSIRGDIEFTEEELVLTAW
ncbi:hypothetical protein [Microbacterium sp. TPD7012]|uniref:hypothetical protein n=1 Tax=Microbacterium sp. TPD7012 TaxID=2171975 RepID=UPI000D5230BD|nr:hypothetical protein [Microbacterium sp. TPD7012]PVE91547.1 hypothetical protein DC434_19235 [Microbacterium sp. TPD7012]